jgi:murein DD-endopeptidase MepM/ murein hydrolase activator NlpD
MKRGIFYLFILFMLAVGLIAGSWNSQDSPAPTPTIMVVQPVLYLGQDSYGFSATRPFIASRQLEYPLDIQPEPDQILASYAVKGQELWTQTLHNGDYLPDPKQDGITRITLKVQYDDPGDLVPNASVVIDQEALEKNLFVACDQETRAEINKGTYVPGDLVVLNLTHLESGQEVSASGNWFNIDPQVFRQGDQAMILYPIPSSTQAGDYALTLHVENERDRTFPVTIEYRDFVMQPLTIDPNVNAATRNDNSYEEFRNMLAVSRNTTEVLPLFDSAFVLPLEGRMTTEYGQGRTINGVPSGSRHSGYDLAAPTGTEIAAPQRGKVRFAGELIMTGNTIIIEHGLGIFSQYYHMDSLSVEAGQMVESGDIIGTVGSTGFSTGPHLHFCLYVNGAYVDPAVFLDKSFSDFIQFLPQ